MHLARKLCSQELVSRKVDNFYFKILLYILKISFEKCIISVNKKPKRLENSQLIRKT